MVLNTTGDENLNLLVRLKNDLIDLKSELQPFNREPLAKVNNRLCSFRCIMHDIMLISNFGSYHKKLDGSKSDAYIVIL